MKPETKSAIFCCIATVVFICFFSLFAGLAEAKNSVDWRKYGSVSAITDTANVISFTPEPVDDRVRDIVDSVLDKGIASTDSIEVRRARTVTPVNSEPIPVQGKDGTVTYFHGPDCQIGPSLANPQGGKKVQKGRVGRYILYEYYNRGEVGPITCPDSTLYFQRDFQ